jgi:glycosyltransferase involved in cell wall biosynthesis
MESLTSIIVPFYNEENLLKQSVLDLVKEDFHKEIVLVNDGSVDNSKTIALDLEAEYENIILIDSKENKGKGFAIQLGLQNATGDLVGIYDADLEYSASDLKNLVDCVKNEDIDYACGSRFIGNIERNNIYLRTFIANKFLSYLFSFVHSIKITDIATCLKVFKKDVLSEFNFEKNDFSIEVELIARVSSKTKKYKELPISYSGRSYEQGKKIKVIDGLKYIFAIFKYK